MCPLGIIWKLYTDLHVLDQVGSSSLGYWILLAAMLAFCKKVASSVIWELKVSPDWRCHVEINSSTVTRILTYFVRWPNIYIHMSSLPYQDLKLILGWNKFLRVKFCVISSWSWLDINGEAGPPYKILLLNPKCDGCNLLSERPTTCMLGCLILLKLVLAWYEWWSRSSA